MARSRTLSLALVAWAAVAQADEDASVLDPGGLDPLGVDPDQPVAPALAPTEAAAAVPAASAAGALAPGVAERASARMEVTFADGLAFVDVYATFRGDGGAPGPVDERLPIPVGALPVAVEACLGVAATDPAACRPGTIGAPVPASGAGGTAEDDPRTPRVHVSLEDGGASLRVSAWPALRERALRVRIRVVVEAPVHGSVTRLRWPTPRLGAGGQRPTVRVVGSAAREPRVAGRDASHGPVPVDAGAAVEVAARVPAPSEPVATILRAACAVAGAGATGTCARVRVEAPAQAPAGPVDVVFLIDRSASMQGVAAERVRAVLEGLEAALPAGSRHRRVAFAARAAEVDAPALAPTLHLGSSTRFDAGWTLAASLLASPRARPVVVIVGDGGLTDVDASREAFAAAARAGIEIDAVSLGGEGAAPALREGVHRAGGIVVELGDAPIDPFARDPRLAAVFGPTAVAQVRLRAGRDEIALGPLRAGEELGWLGRLPHGAAVDVPGVRTLELADPGGESSRFIAARLTGAPPAPVATRPLPPRDLLAILRTRLLPGARGCLRRDRAGRPGHAVRAVFELAFADRELGGVDVTGTISPSLRHCLLEATDSLEVPAFPGRVLVRYPVATRAEPAPRPTPMPADLEDEVQRVAEP